MIEFGVRSLYEALAKQTHRGIVREFVDALGRQKVGSVQVGAEERELVDTGVEFARLNGQMRELKVELEKARSIGLDHELECQRLALACCDVEESRQRWKRIASSKDRELIRIEGKNAAQPKLDLSATDDQLFLVWRDGGSVPKIAHSSHDAAKAEAERLAKANPGDRFYVLYTVGNATRLAPGVIWTCSDERFDDRAEIPF